MFVSIFVTLIGANCLCSKKDDLIDLSLTNENTIAWKQKYDFVFDLEQIATDVTQFIFQWRLW